MAPYTGERLLNRLLPNVVEQRQFLHLGIRLQRRLVAGLLVLKVGDAFDHVQVFRAGAVGL